MAVFRYFLFFSRTVYFKDYKNYKIKFYRLQVGNAIIAIELV